MIIRPIPPSKAVLVNWNIAVNNSNGEKHFLGWDPMHERARLSTPIQSFDDETGLGVTLSGSQYNVIGKATKPHEAALLLFNINLMNNRLLIGSDFKWKYPFDAAANLQ